MLIQIDLHIFLQVTGIQGKREWEREWNMGTGTGTCKIVHSSDSLPVRFTEL